MRLYDGRVLTRSRRVLALAFLAACIVASCAEGPVPASAVPLDLQVRNSGLPAGYLWLSMTGHPDTGRWHQFGMAEFFCATCPVPFVGAGASYDVAVLDEACHVRSMERTIGGRLLLEIDLGPTIRLVEAPPLGDWLPEDSTPADPSSIPCPLP